MISHLVLPPPITMGVTDYTCIICTTDGRHILCTTDRAYIICITDSRYIISITDRTSDAHTAVGSRASQRIAGHGDADVIRNTVRINMSSGVFTIRKYEHGLYEHCLYKPRLHVYIYDADACAEKKHLCDVYIDICNFIIQKRYTAYCMR